MLGGVAQLPSSTFVGFTLVFTFVLLFVATLNGLYRAPFHNDIRHQYFLAAKSYGISGMIILSSLYILRLSEFPRRFTAVLFLLLPLSFLFGRYLLNAYNRAMQRRGYGVHKVLIAKYDGEEQEVFQRFNRFPELGYHIEGIITKENPRQTSAKVLGVRRGEGFQSLSDLPAYPINGIDKVIKQRRIDRIFIPTLRLIGNGYSDLIGVCSQHRIKLKLLSRESEELLRFVHVRDIAGITLYAPPRILTDKAHAIAKRVFDIILSAFALCVCAPIFALVALAILVENGPPIIFKQRRALVKGGKEFSFLKFRSMSKDAEQRQEELYRHNKRTGGLFLIDNDPRLTRVGRIIRKFSIDELPQLFNVFLGDMSLVGPRPLSIKDLDNISPENKMAGYYEMRAKARPGITGLWQISGRREVGFREMILLDLYYIENQSLLFDLEILFATLPVVLFGKGAY